MVAEHGQARGVAKAGFGIGQALAEFEFDQEEKEIDGQDDDAGEVGAGQKRSGEGGGAHVDGAGAEGGFAIRADAVVDSNKGPTVGAHSPFFHGLIVAGRGNCFAAGEFAVRFGVSLLKSNSHEY